MSGKRPHIFVPPRCLRPNIRESCRVKRVPAAKIEIVCSLNSAPPLKATSVYHHPESYPLRPTESPIPNINKTLPPHRNEDTPVGTKNDYLLTFPEKRISREISVEINH